jgi:hypothetical protein
LSLRTRRCTDLARRRGFQGGSRAHCKRRAKGYAVSNTLVHKFAEGPQCMQ